MIKCLVVGLDGASFNIVDPLMEEGHLPNLKMLVDRGARGRLRSVMPWQTPAAWTSYSTGVNPGQHGIFGWWRLDEAARALRTNSGNDVSAPRFWELLSTHASTTVGVLNIPMTYPPRPVRGFAISGLDYPDWIEDVPSESSFPDGTFPLLISHGIDYQVFPRWDDSLPIETNLAAWSDAESARVSAAEILARVHAPQFLQVNLFITDYFAHRSKLRSRTLTAAYQAADQLLGGLLRLTGGETTTLVVSDHGSCEIHSFIMVHTLLRDAGLLTFREEIADEHLALWERSEYSGGRSALSVIDDGGRQARRQMYSQIKDQYPGSNVGFSSIDWDKTKAYSVSDYGQVWINRSIGAAAASSRADVEEVAARVNRVFENLKGPEGQMLVAEVIPREKLYRGRYASRSPDLSPVLRDHGYYFCQVAEYYASHFDQVVIPVHHVVDPVSTGSVGDHHPFGLLIASGPGIERGSVLNDSSIVDIAPTVMSLFDCSAPEYFDGVVLQDLWGGIRERKPARGEAALETMPSRDGELKSRLRALGYAI